MAGDPCSLLFGSLKQACENTRTLAGGSSGSSGSSGSGATGNSLLSFIVDPLSIAGGFRHLVLRTAEGIIGGILILVGVNALVKPGNAIKKVAKVVK